MPCYRLLALARPESTPAQLASTFRQVARLVFREKGQFRHIENLGVRPLAYAHRLPREKFEDARFVQCTFDVAPSGLLEVEQMLKGDPTILRHFHLRDESPLAAFHRGVPKRRTKSLSAAMIARGQLFNPTTMKVEPLIGRAER